jgi:hypothetical protein
MAGPRYFDPEATEAVVKLGVRHQDRGAVEIFSREFVPAALQMGQGMTGIFGGRPRIAEALSLFAFLIDKEGVPATTECDGKRLVVPASAAAPGDEAAATAPPRLVPARPSAAPPVSDAVELVPLRRLAWGRSGDKGNHANIGLIARRPEYVPILRDQVTVERVAEFFDYLLEGSVERWELPGLHAFNFLLHDVLGGHGGTSSLRYDPQGKSYAAMLLQLPLAVPPAALGTAA